MTLNNVFLGLLGFVFLILVMISSFSIFKWFKAVNKSSFFSDIKKNDGLVYAFGISWFFSFSLGCVFAGLFEAVREMGIIKGASFTLLIMVVPPIGLMVSTVMALVVTPATFWALKKDPKKFLWFSPVLWLGDAVFIFYFQRIRQEGIALLGSVFLSVFCLLLFGFVLGKYSENELKEGK